MNAPPTLRIGALELDAPLVLAPMAGATNPPFRKLCREQGAGMVVTEMVSARGLVEGNARAWEFVDLRPDEHPVAVQLFGCDPDELAEAALKVQQAGADSVDVNMGCPMKKVVRTGRGAALLRDPGLVERIMRAMSDRVSIPVTAKIRAGWDDSNAVEVAQALEAGGAAAVTIHGRTRSAMYDHHVDLDVIADVKQAVSIAVIGNGDVRDVPSARRMLERTGCDGLMVARGCLGNPWVFAELRGMFGDDMSTAAVADGTGEGAAARGADEVRAMVHRHLALYAECFGEHRTCLEFRKHALWYFRGTPGEDVVRARLRALTSLQAVRDAVDAACDALA